PRAAGDPVRLAHVRYGEQEEALDLFVRGQTVHDLAESGFDLVRSQRSLSELVVERSQAHRSLAACRKLPTIAWPCSEAIDSGCTSTPNNGRLFCDRPIPSPAAASASMFSASGKLSRRTASE